MENTIKLIATILASFFAKGVTVVSESDDTLDDILASDKLYRCISNDDRRGQWYGQFKIECDGEEVTKVLHETLGKPSQVHESGDRVVYNWDINGILVVSSGNSIETFEQYRE